MSYSKEGISFLVAFRDDDGSRTRPWEWCKAYWRYAFPDAEILEGRYDGTPFSKAAALNEAQSRATGGIHIVMDADCFMPYTAVRWAVELIQQAEHATWYLPYANVYRLTQERTEELLATDPTGPYLMPMHTPPVEWCEDSVVGIGFMQVFSRRAWDKVHGYDPRFVGWGGEDKAFWRAMTTLYGNHTRFQNSSYHLYHERVGAGSPATREWPGQEGQTMMNAALSQRYRFHTGDRKGMTDLVEEHD